MKSESEFCPDRVLRASVLIWRPSAVGRRSCSAPFEWSGAGRVAFRNRGGTFCCGCRTAGRLPVRYEKFPVTLERSPFSVCKITALQQTERSAPVAPVESSGSNAAAQRNSRSIYSSATWNALLSRSWYRTNFFCLLPEWELLIQRNSLRIYFLYRQISLWLTVHLLYVSNFKFNLGRYLIKK